MKLLETLGTAFAASGFALLSFNLALYGFAFGLVSCCLLIPVLKKNKLHSLLALQVFFTCANIVGLFNNI
jgi:nicotinamide riboside transporter PnuC